MNDQICYVAQPHDGPVTGNPIFSIKLEIGWGIRTPVDHPRLTQALTKLNLDLPEFKIGKRRFPGVPEHPFVGIAVTPEQAEQLTETVLQKFQEGSGAFSVRLIHNFHVPRNRFEITPELWAANVKRLPRMLPKQFDAACSVLTQSLRIRGAHVTDDEIEGIVELASEYLWPGVMEDAVRQMNM